MREGRPVVEWREGRGYDTSSTRVNSGNHVPARASVDASSVCGIDVTPVCVCVYVYASEDVWRMAACLSGWL